MADKDIALAIIGAAVALAGLLLVYSAFLVAKAADYDTRRKDKFLSAARWSVAPVLASIFCAWVAVRVLLPGHFAHEWASSWLIFTFEIVLALTAIYAIIAVILSAL